MVGHNIHVCFYGEMWLIIPKLSLLYLTRSTGVSKITEKKQGKGQIMPSKLARLPHWSSLIRIGWLVVLALTAL